jgi:hypothetical protein
MSGNEAMSKIDETSGAGQKEHWTVDKKIPAALLLAIAFQTGTAIWWASGASSRLSAVEERNLRLEMEVGKLRDSSGDIRERFAKAETTMQAFVETTRRIESKLDRLLDEKDQTRTFGPR